MANSSAFYFGELVRKIRRYRIEIGITQKDLSSIAGISVRSIQRFEKGEDISLENFIRILIALGLSDMVNASVPDMDERPSAYLNKSKNQTRQRVRKNRSENVKDSVEFKWGDEQ